MRRNYAVLPDESSSFEKFWTWRGALLRHLQCRDQGSRLFVWGPGYWVEVTFAGGYYA